MKGRGIKTSQITKFCAHPHPGPLPRGEGETLSASWRNFDVQRFDCRKSEPALPIEHGEAALVSPGHPGVERQGDGMHHVVALDPPGAGIVKIAVKSLGLLLRAGVARIMRFAFELALSRPRRGRRCRPRSWP